LTFLTAKILTERRRDAKEGEKPISTKNGKRITPRDHHFCYKNPKKELLIFLGENKSFAPLSSSPS